MELSTLKEGDEFVLKYTDNSTRCFRVIKLNPTIEDWTKEGYDTNKDPKYWTNAIPPEGSIMLRSINYWREPYGQAVVYMTDEAKKKSVEEWSSDQIVSITRLN